MKLPMSPMFMLAAIFILNTAAAVWNITSFIDGHNALNAVSQRLSASSSEW